MTASPYSASGLACARSVVSDANWLANLTEARRAELVTMALEILRKDRAARTAMSDALAAPDAAAPVSTLNAEVIPMPRRPTRHRLKLLHSPTPGDAA